MALQVRVLLQGSNASAVAAQQHSSLGLDAEAVVAAALDERVAEVPAAFGRAQGLVASLGSAQVDQLRQCSRHTTDCRGGWQWMSKSQA